MKTTTVVASFFLFSFSIFGCGKSSDVAATINGKPITMKEVDQAFNGKVAEQIYQLRKNALDSIIEQKLLEQAAAEKKLTVEEFFKQEVDSKVNEPTEEEIKTIYEANADRYGEKFEQVREGIAGALKNNRINIQRNALLSQLKEKSKIEAKLEKPPVVRAKVSIDGTDRCMGPDNAKITLVEFTDFQCPFCGRARPTIDQLLETYKQDLKYCYRDFPLSFHQDAQLAAVASQCGFEQGSEKGWKYFRNLFNNQRALKSTNLKQYAKEMGLNTEPFNQCLDTQKFLSKVQKDLQEGIQAGVSGTPGFFVNGILLSGAQPFANFKEIIDEELKK